MILVTLVDFVSNIRWEYNRTDGPPKDTRYRSSIDTVGKTAIPMSPRERY